ncbi:MAG: hypothetical protein M3440_06185 [Chloroflexota bacterium]|nr:hypothetical protein [Chloroflexota bacterium]
MTDQSDATQADAAPQSQADDDTATQADAQETISLDEAKKLRSEAASLRKRLKDAETKAQAAEVKDRQAQEAKAKEQGEWEKVAQQRADDLAEAQRKLAERDLKDMKVAAAKKAGLPDDLVDRLAGTTAEELETDAKALAKHIAPRDAAETDAGKRSSSAKGATKPDNYLESYTFGTRPIT